MSLSNSKTFRLNVNELCTRSLRIAGVVGVAETVSSEIFTEARNSLNLVMNEIETFTDPLWLRDEFTIASADCISGSGTLDADIVDVIRVIQTNDEVDTIVSIIPYKDFLAIPDKDTTTGNDVLKIAFKKSYDSIEWFVYPTQLESTFDGSLTVHAIVKPNDALVAGNDIEIPTKYFQMLVYAVAADLAILFQRDAETINMLQMKYEMMKRDFKRDNVENPTDNEIESAF